MGRAWRGLRERVGRNQGMHLEDSGSGSARGGLREAIEKTRGGHGEDWGRHRKEEPSTLIHVYEMWR